MSNCTNPNAVNYNPAATSDDGSCIYLKKVSGVCYAFQDLAPADTTDKSFTLSWSVAGKNWVFFHDYVPDFYLNLREQLLSLKDNSLYKHNKGPHGKYYTNTIKPFFVDMVFTGDTEGTLNTLEWITEVVNSDGSVSPQETFTHITLWNSKQCTGRIPLNQIFKELQYQTSRETAGKWSFNDFRNKVKAEGVAFLQDLFHNFAIIDASLSNSIPWFEQQLMEDNYFVARFEFDNVSNKKFLIHETGAQIVPSIR